MANALAADGRLFSPVSSPYLVPPGMVRAQSGAPLRVFGPFRRAWEAVGWDAPAPRPRSGSCPRPVPPRSRTSSTDWRRRGRQGCRGGGKAYRSVVPSSCQQPGRRRRWPGWNALPKAPWRHMRRAVKTRAKTGPPSFRHTCTSAACTPGPLSSAWVRARAPNGCVANWRGGTSTPTSCGTNPVLSTSRYKTSAGTCAGTTTAGRGKGSGRGRRAGRATRWWTRACASC